MLLVLLLVVTSVQADGIKAPDECPTCEKWLGTPEELCAYNDVTYSSKCELFVDLCKNGVIDSSADVDINLVDIDTHVEDYIEHMGKCETHDLDNCPKCDTAPSNPVCAKVASGPRVDFINYCSLAKHLCKTGVLGFGDIDFSVLDEDYYEARSDVLVFVNWKGPCTGPCPRGEHAINRDGMRPCSQCEVGMYQNQKGASFCKQCPESRTTLQKGSVSVTQCVCAPGSFDNIGTCDLCPVGSYQGLADQSSCTQCPVNFTTLQPGATQSSQCVAKCSPGMYSKTGYEDCTNCSKGTYQPLAGQTFCTTCPTDTTTLGEGATQAGQCLAKCPPGSWSVDGYTDCALCPQGTYQSLPGRNYCTACPAGHVTRRTGCTDCSECVGKCPQGSVSRDGYTPCTQCTGNTYINQEGGTVCRLCEGGVVNSNNTQCVLCTEGEHSTGAQCEQCPAGSYTDVKGSVSCTQCAPGHYAEFPGSTQCMPCKEGSIQMNKGSESCELCMEGRYSDKPAATSCTWCTQGHYSNERGAVTCQACSQGSYESARGSKECKLCTPGSFANITGAVHCSRCAPGHFTDQYGAKECEACKEGSYEAKTGTTECKLCAPGSYSNATGALSCKLCEPGHFTQPNKYGSKICEVCKKGSFGGASGSTECKLCSPGQYSDLEGAVNCTKCSKGYYTPPESYGAEKCEACHAGEYQPNTAATKCLKCKAGSYSDEGSERCELCAPGHYSASGAGQCTGCDKGSYQDKSGSTKCKLCDAGSYSEVEGSGSCTLCAPGHYSAAKGSSGCTACSAGSYQADSAAKECKICGPGSYSDVEGAVSCSQCTAGHYSNTTGSTACTECSAGSYQAHPGSIACDPCTPGSYSNTSGSTHCTDCSPGYYGEQTGRVGCIACQAGSYQYQAAARHCLRCSAGSYSAEAAVDCEKCLPGSYSDEGADECVDCSKGRYAPFSGATKCLLCGPGTHSDIQGAATCPPCNIGYYSNSTGSETCTECDKGTHQPDTGSTKCVTCPDGTYSDQTASAMCKQCPDNLGASGATDVEHCGAYNWAQQGTAFQSGTTWNGTADKATAGNNSAQCLQGYCTHTEFMNNPWWYVDLGEQRRVVEIGVMVPSDTLSGIQGARVTVGNNNDSLDTLCGVLSFNSLVNYKQHLVCGTGRGIKGRFVRVEVTIEQQTYLSLCEVEVYAVSPKLPCPKGSVSNTGYRPCKLCPKGSTTRTPGSTACLPCPHGWTTYKHDPGTCNGPRLFACNNPGFLGECETYTGPTSSLGYIFFDRKISSLEVQDGDWIVYSGTNFTSTYNRTTLLSEGWKETNLKYVKWGWGRMDNLIRSVQPSYQHHYCYLGYGEEYIGREQVTVSGRPCQKWSAQWPHRHSFTMNHTGLGDHAYCRNPDKSNTGPWCLTTELDMTREACHVPRCNAVCKPGHHLDLNVCVQCPSGTYSANGVICDHCPQGKTSFPGSISIADCFTQHECEWWSNYDLCDQLAGCRYGCARGWCWKQCNNSCKNKDTSVPGVCQTGCHEWCYLDGGKGYYKSCKVNEDCSEFKRNECQGGCGNWPIIG